MVEVAQEELQAKEKAKSIVVDLVQQFKRDIVDTGRVKTYNEESVKVQFITPLFEALGWNTSDQNEVFYETNIKGKRSDYLFKLNNKEVFIVEAKKPSVNLKIGTTQGDLAAKQAINYAWHKNINFAVLTDFEEIRVFHALERPRTVARNLARHKEFGIISLEYGKFEEEFDKLWLLSRWSVENGVLDACLSEKDKRTSKTVDSALLADLLKIREWLAKDIKKRNTHLDEDRIGELVQRWINRLIFIRTTEDRGLEQESLLLNLASDAKFQKLDRHLKLELLHVFRDFDKKYNSKLFAHLDLDDSTLVIDQQTLIKVIYALYYGTDGNTYDRYNFNLIPSDLLGRIYEQYLGIILKTTEKRATLVDAKAKRKKMGIYYTPGYIVDYIVRNTIGEALKGKNLEEISKFKIVDPASGSGSFLLRAFDEVCKFVKERIDSGDSYDLFDKKYLSPDGTLSLGQKIKILRNNIYGVDLDQQALEICKLSLLLKLLENEGPDTKKCVLPTLEDNLQCGNSLIDDESIAGDKAFKWRYRFKDVFKQGGFDVVVGNPPYLKLTKNNTQKDVYNYYEQNFKSISGGSSKNLFQLFIEKMLNMRPKHFSFIVPEALLTSASNGLIRKLMLEKLRFEKVAIFDNFVFGDANIGSTIFVLAHKKVTKGVNVQKISNNGDVTNIKKMVEEELSNTWDTSSNDECRGVLAKISHKTTLLKDISKMSKGMVVKDRKKHLREEPIAGDLPFVLGKSMNRYFLKYKYFTKYDELTIIGGTRDLSKHIKFPRLLIRRTGNYLCVAFSNSVELIESTVYFLTSKIDLKYLLAILNSKLLTFYLKQKLLTNIQGYPQVLMWQLDQLPIKISDESIVLSKLAKQMLDLNKRLQDAKTEHEKEQIKRQIASTDSEIDDKVYKLYGLTDEEIDIVENG